MATASDRYWELIKEQLTEERARKTSVESRAVAVITSSATMVTLLFGLTALATKASQTYVLRDPIPQLLGVGAGAFLLAGVLSIAINWAVHYNEVTPEGLEGLLTEDWDADEGEAAKAVGEAWIDILTVAREKNRFKGILLRGAMLAEVSGVTLVAVGVFLVLVNV